MLLKLTYKANTYVEKNGHIRWLVLIVNWLMIQIYYKHVCLIKTK